MGSESQSARSDRENLPPGGVQTDPNSSRSFGWNLLLWCLTLAVLAGVLVLWMKDVDPRELIAAFANRSGRAGNAETQTDDGGTRSAGTSDQSFGTQSLNGERYALLIGVKHYSKASGLRPLLYTENDASALAAVLTESGYRAENVVVMTSAEAGPQDRFSPRRDNILVEMKALLTGRKSGDSVLDAFFGHGVQFGEDAYFCPVDSILSSRDTLVSMQEVYAELEACPAGLKMLLSDACRDNPINASSRRAEVKLDSETRPVPPPPPGGVVAFFSCSKGEVSFEDEALEHGVFSHFLIEGLKGEADSDDDGRVNVYELVQYTTTRVPDYIREQFDRTSQRPNLLGNIVGSPVLVEYRTTRANDSRRRVNDPTASRTPAPKLTQNSYERGFADTILRYEARNYDGGTWKEEINSESLAIITRSGKPLSFNGVLGWASDNYWIVGDVGFHDGVAIHYDNGDWVSPVKFRSVYGLVWRLAGPDTLLFLGEGSSRSGRGFWLVSPRGVTLNEKVTSQTSFYKFREIVPAEPDLYYLLGEQEPITKIRNGEVERINRDGFKEAFVHNERNLPIDWYAGGIRHARVYEAGRAIGLVEKTGERGRQLVELRDGTWFTVGFAMNLKYVNDAWLSCKSGVPESYICASDSGRVHVFKIGEAHIEDQVPSPKGSPRSSLICVWGLSVEKYWVMDVMGNVWERAENRWRAVVGGPYTNNFKFIDAWVAPSGSVIAVSKDAVYRLD